MATATKTAKFKATFQESILGAVLQKVSRGGRRVDLHALPQEVVDYLQLERANDAAPWTFDGDGFDALAACDGVKVRTRKDAPRQATVEFAVELAKPAIAVEELPRAWHDGAHCGLTDWYEPLEAAITAALGRGKGYAWTTGWYGSKKNCASACITQCGGEITVRVSVSDDFDTEGLGERTIKFTKNLDRIREAIDAAWSDANRDRRDNEPYAGFSVGRGDQWEFTLILPVGWGHEMDVPPGEYYHAWGWQEVEDGEDRPAEIPAEVADALKQWAESPKVEPGMKHTVGEWTIKAWEDDCDA